MLEQEFLRAKIKEYMDHFDLRTLRMVWSFVKKLRRDDDEEVREDCSND